MSDFDAFTSSEPPAQEEDPAADFLAREQEELAELNDDNFTGAEFTTQQAGFGGYDPLAGDNSQQAIPASLDVFSAPPSNDDFGFGGSGEGGISTLDSLDQRLEQEESVGVSDPYSSVRSVDTERKEPEKIRIWREEQREMLEKKDREEAGKMEEWREQARKELDDWYRHRDEQFQKAKALNRESEAEFIKERDESLPGHEWERICRLCEFNPKHSRSQKDVSRMRSILLQLKQNPSVQAKVM